MHLPTCQFKVPFETGAPFVRNVYEFSYRDKFDKYYILNVNDFLSRGEVIELAIKNSHMIALGLSKDIRNGSKTIRYGEDEGFEKPPEIFGTFLGNFIPLIRSVPNRTLRETSTGELVESAKLWSNEFYEPFVEFWFEFIPGPHTKMAGIHKAWFCFAKQHDVKLWMPQYQELIDQGMKRSPSFDSMMQMHQLL